MTDWLGRQDRRPSAISPVVLAHEIPFRFGTLLVEPALRRVSTDDGREEVLQPRTMQVLVFFQHTLGRIVPREDLTESCWSGVAVSDDSINRVIAQLRKLAEGIADRSFVIETITKVGYRVTLSPARETPAEIVSARPQASAPLLTALPTRRGIPRLGVLTAAFTALSAIGVLGWQLRGSPVPSGPAVVEIGPFSVSGPNLASDFGRSVREEVATGRTSGVQAKLVDTTGSGAPGTWRLSGRIVSEKGTVHSYARLLRPGDDTPVWSPRFDLPLAQASAAGVGQQLREGLTCVVAGDNSMRPRGISREALEAYGAYCQENSKGGFYDNQRQVDALREAVRLEPRFARAWADLGLFLSVEADQASGSAALSLRTEGLNAARESIRLRPDVGYGYSVLSHYAGPREFKIKEQYLRRAVSMPGDGASTAHQSYAYFLGSIGRVSEAIEQHQRSLDTEPDNAFDLLPIAYLESYRGNYGRAQAIIAKEISLRSDPERALRFRLSMALSARDWNSARQTLGQLPESTLTKFQTPLVQALASGSQKLVDEALRPFGAMKSPTLFQENSAAEAFAAGNHPDEALDAVRRLVARSGVEALTVTYQPSFGAIRRSEAYSRLMEQLGIMAYWRESGIKPDFCRELDAPSYCARLRA